MAVEGGDATVGDGDPVCISGQVSEYLLRSPEGRFGIPPCRGSAAMVRRVSATVRNRMSKTTLRLQKAMAAIALGRVKTT